MSALERLKTIFTSPNETKYALYEKFGTDAIKQKDCDAIFALIDHLVRKEGNDQHGRTYITPEVLVSVIKKLNPSECTDQEAEAMIDIEDLLPLLERCVCVCVYL
jgi:hypothetical protein